MSAKEEDKVEDIDEEKNEWVNAVPENGDGGNEGDQSERNL